METVKTTPLAISEEAQEVRDALIVNRLETPLVYNGLSRDQKYESIRESFADIARTLGGQFKADARTRAEFLSR